MASSRNYNAAVAIAPGKSREKRWLATALQSGLLFGRGFFVGVISDVADDAFAFFDVDHLIGLDVLQGVDRAAGPLDFEEIDFFGLADAKVHAQITLREIAAAAANFIDLRMRLGFAGNLRYTTQPRADTAAIGFRADGADLNPIVL
jgi:hypothetical protein